MNQLTSTKAVRALIDFKTTRLARLGCIPGYKGPRFDEGNFSYWPISEKNKTCL